VAQTTQKAISCKAGGLRTACHLHKHCCSLNTNQQAVTMSNRVSLMVSVPQTLLPVCAACC
jgi:hypothetical protein